MPTHSVSRVRLPHTTVFTPKCHNLSLNFALAPTWPLPLQSDQLQPPLIIAHSCCPPPPKPQPVVPGLAVQQRQSAAAQMPQRGACLLLAALVQRLPALHVCHTLQASQCGGRCPSPHAICITPARLRNSLAQRCATPPLSNPFSFSFFHAAC